MHFLSEDITILSAGASTTGDLSGPIIDCASVGFPEGILFTAFVGGATNTTSLLKVQTGTASGALSDTTGDVPATLGTLYLDHHRPQKRFVKGVLTAGGATGAGRVLNTITYGHRRQPTTYDASATGLRVASPGSGTATG